MSDKISTKYIKANPRLCKACDICITACPKQVIGKVGFLWHKHIIIKNAENCNGCKKCIGMCPHGVFSEINQAI
ncbi:2-oxoglutarate ferredoxin oxidoreductase subunit delta [Dysgonomonas hofstadii]|uniref:2-oxoglutarate ferredoxin oxidoreductase subunit delta n=1 Tax=Dysgonomonas hofstadii TaxID=637886 RepID=A0A840CPG6_9BACT|nr:2-oxoglutarate ferredoxin oxidoreductase subunit delta [Dysgonomonas hofstadii]